MIRVKHIRKCFGNFCAVDDVSFSVKAGEIFGIVGPNGAGKSTIVRMLATILLPTSGNAYLNGLSITEEAQKIREIVGYLPEEPRVYDYMTGREFLELFAGMYKNSAVQAIPKLISFVGLEAHVDRKIGDYSKGLKQRLSIARALLHDPQVLILDEPTMGLDPASAHELREKILEMRDEKKTIVICTHYMDEADFLCDRVAFLSEGRIAAIGKPEELKSRIRGEKYVRVVLKTHSQRFLELVGGKISGRGILVRLDGPVEKVIEKIIDAAASTGSRILTIKTVEPSLDDVFLRLTREQSGKKYGERAKGK